eukprot:Clim_evm11s51 gene=Clim_evmTU11s51
MTTVANINGLEVAFPFQPYRCQSIYMEKVITALQNGQNALLESPTGTGKTLSLLCATLEWRRQRKILAEFVKTQHLDAANLSPEQLIARGVPQSLLDVCGLIKQSRDAHGFLMEVPRIIYASRTHSQLAQVCKELRRTGHDVNVITLASRGNYCVHETISKSQGARLKNQCRMACKTRSCENFVNVEKFAGTKQIKKPERIMDIEELRVHGSQKKMCPYYLTKEWQAEADVILMPYNYLTDPNVSEFQKIDLHNAVVIIDEAHNIESQAQDAISTTFNRRLLDSIIRALHDLDAYHGAFTVEDFLVQNRTYILQLIEDLVHLRADFINIESGLDLDKPSIKAGMDFPDLLQKHLKFGNADQFKNLLNILTKCGLKAEAMRRNGHVIGVAKGDGYVGAAEAFETYRTLLQTVCIVDGVGETKISTTRQMEMRQSFFRSIYTRVQAGKPSDTDASDLQINYWCFSAAPSMNRLVDGGIHSLILTSGTLSPMDGLISQLGVEFPITLQGSHVISSDQCPVAVLTKGPGQQMLKSTYENRSNRKYISDLGMSIYNFILGIPNGVLVFFASKTAMDGCIEQWKSYTPGRQDTIWNSIARKKTVFVEPRSANESKDVVDEFKKCAENDTGNGAILFCVCRGRLSEGVDFADKHARAVIITGIPYPPLYDLRTKMKRECLDLWRREGYKCLSGTEWYSQEAFRATNQAIGRVIRHRYDFGAVLLLDERFSGRARLELPAWIAGKEVIYENFGPAVARLRHFFRDMNEKSQELEIPSLPAQKTDQETAMREKVMKVKAANFWTMIKESMGPEAKVAIKKGLAEYHKNQDNAVLKNMLVEQFSKRLFLPILSTLKTYLPKTAEDIVNAHSAEVLSQTKRSSQSSTAKATQESTEGTKSPGQKPIKRPLERSSQENVLRAISQNEQKPKQETSETTVPPTKKPKTSAPKATETSLSKSPTKEAAMCVLCERKANTPWVAPCSHRGCYACWLKRINEDKRKKKTPLCPAEGCKQPIAKKTLRKIYHA